MGKWGVIILFFSTFLFAPCDACPRPLLRIRNKIDGRQVEGFIVRKYSENCNNDIVRSYTATKGGEASSLRGSCNLLYVSGKLKVPITPPINIPIAGVEVPSVTLPGNEEECRTYVETDTNPPCVVPVACDKYLDVIRNATTNECVIVEGNP